MAGMNATPLKVPRKLLRQQIQHHGDEDATVQAALAILAKRMSVRGSFLSNPQAVRDYFRLTRDSRNFDVTGIADRPSAGVTCFLAQCSAAVNQRETVASGQTRQKSRSEK